MVFPVVMYGCENWTIKKGERRRVESPFDFMEIQPVHPKGDMSWVFFGRTDSKAETPILWLPHVKSWLIGKTDAGRNWGQEQKRMTEVEKTRWHQQLNGHEFEWTLGVGDGQGGLTCYDLGVAKSWTRLVTELNWRRIVHYAHLGFIFRDVRMVSIYKSINIPQWQNWW